jgi:hypothetical protein
MKQLFFTLFVVTFFMGCITTFQTAETLPPGEEVLGVGGMFPGPPLEVYYRLGLTDKMDMGFKADLLYEGWYGLRGEVKFQFRDSPVVLAGLFGTGAYIPSPNEGGLSNASYFIYPTLLAGGRHIYFGARSTIMIEEVDDRTSFSVHPGIVAGLSINMFSGKYSLLPEVNVYFEPTSKEQFLMPGIALQWNAYR